MDNLIIDAAQQQAEICKVFGNVNRILILWVLGNEEMSVGDIAEAIDSSVQNTSQHLRLMKDKGIVASRRDGHVIYYHAVMCKGPHGCLVLPHARYAEPMVGK